MNNGKLYETEEAVLTEAEEIIKNHLYLEHPLYDHFIRLMESFEKILKDSKKIIKISDSQQVYLRRIQTELKNEIKYREQAEEKLKIIAATDSLTGVFNRGKGLSMLEEQIQSLKSENGICTICYLDANGLKYINDNFGHIMGDELLLLICKTLRAEIRTDDFICRMGGDEFLVIFPKLSADQAKERINQALVHISAIENNMKVTYSFSYGVVQIDEHNHKTIDEIIEIADKAMYEHKKAYKVEKSGNI